MVRVAASITGVLRIPSGWMLPQLTPFACAGVPMLLVHTVAPLVSSIAITSLPVVAMKNRPLPVALAGARYSGEAHTLPVNLAPVLNAASAVIVAAAVLVNFGCTNKPSREALLLRCNTLSDWFTGGAPPEPPAGGVPPAPAVGPLPAAAGEPPAPGEPALLPEPATGELPALPFGAPALPTGAPAPPAAPLGAPATLPGVPA